MAKTSQNPENEDYQCKLCRKSLKHKYSLSRHVKVVHQDYRPHICECGKAFATREQYTRHMNSKHTFDRPYPCEKGCGRGFASYSARAYHHNVVHDELKYPCPFIGCGKVYSSKIHLRNHLLKPHNNLFLLINLINWFP